MFVLILLILFGLLYGYFSTLNTGAVSVHFGMTSVEGVPMYIVILLSIGLGILFSTIFYSVKSIFSTLTVSRHKDEVTRAKRETADALKRIHQLEIENAKLKTKFGVADDDDSI